MRGLDPRIQERRLAKAFIDRSLQSYELTLVIQNKFRRWLGKIRLVPGCADQVRA